MVPSLIPEREKREEEKGARGRKQEGEGEERKKRRQEIHGHTSVGVYIIPFSRKFESMFFLILCVIKRNSDISIKGNYYGIFIIYRILNFCDEQIIGKYTHKYSF